MMAVEAEAVGTVIQFDVLVFNELGVMPLGLDQLVAIHAVVAPPHTGEIEPLRFPDGFLVEMVALRQASGGLFWDRFLDGGEFDLRLGDNVAAAWFWVRCNCMKRECRRCSEDAGINHRNPNPPPTSGLLQFIPSLPVWLHVFSQCCRLV